MFVAGDENVGNSAGKLATLVPLTPCSVFSSRWLETRVAIASPTGSHVIEVQLSRLLGSTRPSGRVVGLDAM